MITLDDDMRQVLYILCQHCVDIMGGWMPYPMWAIAEQSKFSKWKTRKTLNKLRDAGYCEVISEILSEDNLLPYRGWTITKKAHETDEYKRANLKEAKLCAECFGGNYEQYL